MQKKILTTLENEIIYSALVDERDQLIELSVDKLHEQSMVGHIYIGKVTNAMPGVQAVFVSIGLEQDVFLQIKDDDHFIYTNGKESSIKPSIGDELIIQIIKDAYMSKAPTATSMMSIDGRYCVLTYSKCFIGMSSKIKEKNEKERLKSIFEKGLTNEYGFIVRTNAEYVEEDVLIEEMDDLVEKYDAIIQTAPYRKCNYLLYKQPSKFIKFIRDANKSDITQYSFDDETLFDLAKAYFNHPIYPIENQLVLHTDAQYNLYKLYSLKSKIQKALQEKVWLKSGANLIIQRTEALVVIDVNTSKSVGKKNNVEQAIYNINLEAAFEIAKQVRLRNLSGIIIIDFIDMQEDENKQKLMMKLQKCFDQDRIKTTVVDMTALGLVEVTRKKSDKSLYEVLEDVEE